MAINLPVVSSNYKTMKTEELKYHVDSMMEISSRIQCLGELYTFAAERLRYYQELNKDKGPVDLLSILESGEESSDNLREVYMERQYSGYCKHLQGTSSELFSKKIFNGCRDYVNMVPGKVTLATGQC